MTMGFKYKFFNAGETEMKSVLPERRYTYKHRYIEVTELFEISLASLAL